MSYVGFGIQSMNSFRKPRRAFKPIFEQFANGEHPTTSLSDSISGSWRELREHPRLREMKERVMSSYIYLGIVIAILGALVANMV